LPIGEKSKFEAGYRLDVNNNDYNNDVRQKLADDTASDFYQNTLMMQHTKKYLMLFMHNSKVN
jgi:hypothetical protein